MDTKVAQRALCNLCAHCALVVKINWEVKKKKNCGKNATVEFALFLPCSSYMLFLSLINGKPDTS
jgi:hypothetical protein